MRAISSWTLIRIAYCPAMQNSQQEALVSDIFNKIAKFIQEEQCDLPLAAAMSGLCVWAQSRKLPTDILRGLSDSILNAYRQHLVRIKESHL